MFEDQPVWLVFVGKFGMPILLLAIVLFVVWDRRRAKRATPPERPEPWREVQGYDRPAPAPEAPILPYRVYTREFDLELDASEIPGRLKAASPDRVRWTDSHGVGWAVAIGLTAQFARKQPPAAELAEDLRQRIGDTSGLAVTLLLDQSGSMRGEPIASTAAALAQVEAGLRQVGAVTEVLGFSTDGWHGGHVRAKWLKDDRPPHPGRLCALLHIIYKSAADSEWRQQSREAMLHPDILRENIDGEALDWAAARLAASPCPRKLLIILSDGAPVDDSTLKENGSAYLELDLRRAIAAIESRDDIALGAIGIGYAVGRYYTHSRKSDAGTLTADLIALIGDLALQHNPATAPPSLGE